MSEATRKKREKKPGIWVSRRGQILVPADVSSSLLIGELRFGTEYEIHPVQPRSGARNRMFWAFCNLVAHALTDGTGVVWTKEDVCEHFKRAVGHYRIGTVIMPGTGNKANVIDYKSIAFDKFPDEESFIRFFMRVVAHVRTSLLPHFDGSPLASDMLDIIHKVESLQYVGKTS